MIPPTRQQTGVDHCEKTVCVEPRVDRATYRDCQQDARQREQVVALI